MNKKADWYCQLESLAKSPREFSVIHSPTHLEQKLRTRTECGEYRSPTQNAVKAEPLNCTERLYGLQAQKSTVIKQNWA